MVFGPFFLIAWVIILVVGLSLLGGTLFATTAYSVFSGAPFLPTDERNVDDMIRSSGLKPGELLVDLGSGDGRILIAAARAGARAEGWEISPFLCLWSQWKIRRAGVADKAKVHLGSYWTETFRQADVVTLFLITSQMGRMEKKLRSELPVGSRVVSYAFKFPHWELADKTGRGVYLYRQTERKAP